MSCPSTTSLQMFYDSLISIIESGSSNYSSKLDETSYKNAKSSLKKIIFKKDWALLSSLIRKHPENPKFNQLIEWLEKYKKLVLLEKNSKSIKY